MNDKDDAGNATPGSDDGGGGEEVLVVVTESVGGGKGGDKMGTAVVWAILEMEDKEETAETKNKATVYKCSWYSQDVICGTVTPHPR